MTEQEEKIVRIDNKVEILATKVHNQLNLQSSN